MEVALNCPCCNSYELTVVDEWEMIHGYYAAMFRCNSCSNMYRVEVHGTAGTVEVAICKIEEEEGETNG